MDLIWRRALACFLALTLLAVLCLGCGGPSSGKVTIAVGFITDLTGPAGNMVRTLNYMVEDVARYHNDEDIIPGVEIDIVTFDGRADPARDIPGYDWLRERGAEVVITLVGATGQILKPFAEKDKVPLATLSGNLDLLDPPGWAFWFSVPSPYEIKALLKWISEKHWDDASRVPRIGFTGWNEPTSQGILQAMEEYCQDHPDQFEWGGGYLVPLGTLTWGGEVDSLKECDYIHGPITGTPLGNFVKKYRAAGHTTTMISISSGLTLRGFLIDMLGWDVLDGWLSTSIAGWWTEQSPMQDLVKEVLYRYRAGEAEDIIREGNGYQGGFHNVYAMFEVLREAVEEVGAENFDGQAFYDAAVKYKTAWEGYPEWGFSETKRYLIDHMQVFQWSAEAEDLVRLSGWLPIVID